VKLEQGHVARPLLLGPHPSRTGQAEGSGDRVLGRDPIQPARAGPYVALGELYRKWDYTDEAIKVTSQGAVNVPGQNEISDIWYVLGMGYDDKQNFDKAIEAFDKAIETKRDNHKAKFQRGQAYFRKGDMTHAKRDLEDFSKTGGASLEFAKQQAQKMLMDIAAKSAGDKPPEPMKSPEDLVRRRARRAEQLSLPTRYDAGSNRFQAEVDPRRRNRRSDRRPQGLTRCRIDQAFAVLAMTSALHDPRFPSTNARGELQPAWCWHLPAERSLW
jgi:tetratricopeptide (TPR) repeat protein